MTETKCVYCGDQSIEGFEVCWKCGAKMIPVVDNFEGSAVSFCCRCIHHNTSQTGKCYNCVHSPDN